jgi:hypothetical protein
MRTPRHASGYTVAEYSSLLDEGVLGEDDHVELLEGVIVAGEPQNPPHASGVWRVHRALERAVRRPCHRPHAARLQRRAAVGAGAGRRGRPAGPRRVRHRPPLAGRPLRDRRLLADPGPAHEGSDRRQERRAAVCARQPPRRLRGEPHRPQRPAPPLLRAHGPSSWRALTLVALPDVTIAVDDFLPPRMTRPRRA